MYQEQVRELEQVKDRLDERITKLDQDLLLKSKEHARKLDQESSLLERCREYIQTQKAILDDEKSVLADKTRIRRVNDDVLKLQSELDKALRDQRLMGMIVDNYVKEINKRKQIEEAGLTKPKTPDGSSSRVSQSAN